MLLPYYSFSVEYLPDQQPTKCDKAGHYMSFNAVQLSSLYFGWVQFSCNDLHKEHFIYFYFLPGYVIYDWGFRLYRWVELWVIDMGIRAAS